MTSDLRIIASDVFNVLFLELDGEALILVPNFNLNEVSDMNSRSAKIVHGLTNLGISWELILSNLSDRIPDEWTVEHALTFSQCFNVPSRSAVSSLRESDCPDCTKFGVYRCKENELQRMKHMRETGVWVSEGSVISTRCPFSEWKEGASLQQSVLDFM